MSQLYILLENQTKIIDKNCMEKSVKSAESAKSVKSAESAESAKSVKAVESGKVA